MDDIDWRSEVDGTIGSKAKQLEGQGEKHLERGKEETTDVYVQQV